MHSTPTIFIVQLLAFMQVLMTLDMPLSTTMALPVTSKPIESTVENMAWQAWIELPPEQKQRVKSRKVTPKSIFTLPLRVVCPEGHQQVGTKCIPLAVGSNSVLVDADALGLIVGDTQTEDFYDYYDSGEQSPNPLRMSGEMLTGEVETSGDGVQKELKPSSNNEPLKIPIFENVFNIFNEDTFLDSAPTLNGGPQSTAKELNLTTFTAQAISNAHLKVNITVGNNSLRGDSNVSKDNLRLSGPHDSGVEESNTFVSQSKNHDFGNAAITLPALGSEITQKNQLLTFALDTEVITTNHDARNQPEYDIKTLLQTESLMPLLNNTTATTSLNKANESLNFRKVPLQVPKENSNDNLNFKIDEEITALPYTMEQVNDAKDKQEYIRSITENPIIANDRDIVEAENNDYNDPVRDSTLEIETNDEPLETTTPIQLDDTTIIESHSALSTTTEQLELKGLLLEQEQSQKDFEELQRMRKGQKDQHFSLKKSKVQPVEVSFTSTESTVKTTTGGVDELWTTTEETVTPLLAANNENNQTYRFTNQHLAKQNSSVKIASDNELKPVNILAASKEQSAPVVTAVITPANSTISEIIPLTSEIDVQHEINLINNIVKTIRPEVTSTTKPTTHSENTTTTTTTKLIATTKKPKLNSNNIQSSSSSTTPSSVPTPLKKPIASRPEVRSKIMPLLTTSTAASTPKVSTGETLNQSHLSDINLTQIDNTKSSSSLQSNRNSKITQIDNFNRVAAENVNEAELDTTAAVTTATTIHKLTTFKEYETSNGLSSSALSAIKDPHKPSSWRLNTLFHSTKQSEEREAITNFYPLLLRFRAAHTPKSR